MEIYNDAFDAIYKDDPAKARLMKTKSDLMDKICDHLKSENITQLEASKIIGCQQPRVSRLIGGKISEFSLGWLYLAMDKLEQ